MSEEIRQKVYRTLTENGVAFNVTYRGLKPAALGGEHAMDEWQCTFSRNGRSEVFEFFTGLGLRAAPTDAQKQQARYQTGNGLTTNDIERRTILGRKYLAMVESLRTPKAPAAADVLSSLILDSSACGQSFASWCADYGYDEDSRKVEAIYRACQENGDKLARIIPHATRETLADLLSEY